MNVLCTQGMYEAFSTSIDIFPFAPAGLYTYRLRKRIRTILDSQNGTTHTHIHKHNSDSTTQSLPPFSAHTMKTHGMLWLALQLTHSHINIAHRVRLDKDPRCHGDMQECGDTILSLRLPGVFDSIPFRAADGSLQGRG